MSSLERIHEHRLNRKDKILQPVLLLRLRSRAIPSPNRATDLVVNAHASIAGSCPPTAFLEPLERAADATN